MQPLQDVRILAVTVFLAGPFLSMTLARFGADRREFRILYFDLVVAIRELIVEGLK